MTTFRVVANITRHETVEYEIEGVGLTEDDLLAEIEGGTWDPVKSTIHNEDIDIVEIKET